MTPITLSAGNTVGDPVTLPGFDEYSDGTYRAWVASTPDVDSSFVDTDVRSAAAGRKKLAAHMATRGARFPGEWTVTPDP